VRCPFCKVLNKDRVVDSRTGEGGSVIRRRRKCEVCRKRFTTYERIEDAIKLSVIKKDRRHEPYDRNKLLASIERACTKRPVTSEQIQKMLDDVEEELFANFDREVPSKFIGERTASRLRQIDKVAYVRFASVYREFRDVSEFIEEAQNVLRASGVDSPGQRELFDAISRLAPKTDADAAAAEPADAVEPADPVEPVEVAPSPVPEKPEPGRKPVRSAR